MKRPLEWTEVSREPSITVRVISANLGAYDRPHDWVPQRYYGVRIEVHRLTDENFPLRTKAMTPALQAGIPKMLGWQMFEPADFYIWVDASCALLHPGSVAWFVKQCGQADMAVFKHPDRSSVREEYAFVKQKLIDGNGYLTARYRNEWLDEQYRLIASDQQFIDNALYASTAFVYRPTPEVKMMMEEWFYMKCRYLLHDQLTLPWLIDKYALVVNVIEENYLKCEYLTYVRNKR